MTEQKKTKFDLVYVYAAYSLRYVNLLILIPFYARMLAPEGYGLVLAAMSLMQVIWLFVNWGFGLDGMREIATTNRNDYAALFGKHLTARLWLTAIAVSFGAVAVYYSQVLSEAWVAGGLAIALGVISAFNLGWYFNGSDRPRKAVQLEVVGFGLNLVLILAMVRAPEDAMYVILGLFLSGVVALSLAHWWIRSEVLPLKLDWSAGFKMIKSTLPIFIYSSSAMLLGASSTYLLSTMSDASQVGFFGSAERLVSAGLSLMIPMGAVFIPKVTVQFNDNQVLAFKTVLKVMLLLVAVGTLGLVVTLLGGDVIVDLIFGDGFSESAPILKMLSIIFPFYAATLALSSYLLLPLKQEKLLGRVMIAGAVVNILFALALGPKYQGMGMAYARVISEVFTFMCLFICCYKLGYIQKIFKPNSTIGQPAG